MNSTTCTEAESRETPLLEIESLSNQAEGVARIEGKVVFVPFALPNERARVRIAESHKGFDRAIPIRITKKASERVDPPCPYFGECGGCQLQHMDYQAALEAKRGWLQEALLKLGKIDFEVPPIAPSDPYHYRSKSRFFPTGHFDPPLGLKKVLSPAEVLPIRECWLCRPTVGYAFEELSRRIADADAKGDEIVFTAVTLQESSNGIVAVIEGVKRDWQTENWRRLFNAMPEIHHAAAITEEKKGRRRFECLVGEDYWTYRMGRYDVQASPGTFHQVNPGVGEALYDRILEWIGERRRRVVEAYCGSGSLALELAKSFRQVRAADVDKRAVSLGKRKAREAGVENVVFACRSAEEFLYSDAVTNKRPDLLILDPPRAGCSPRVLQGVAALRPRRLIVVSCHPAAFARDLGKLVQSSYKLMDINGFDMFPQTFHLEAAALLEYNGC